MTEKKLSTQIDLDTAKRIEALSLAESRSISQIASAAIKLGSILPHDVWTQLWKLNATGTDEDWQAIAAILARSLLEHRYQSATASITQHFDSQWLNTLETEDDLLEAAVELTKNA